MQKRRPLRRRRKRKPAFPWLELFAAAAAFLILGAVSYWAYGTFITPAGAHETEDLAQPEQPEMIEFNEPAGEWRPKEPTTHTSILLMGLDKHGMSDLIMIVSYDMQTFESSLLSIKRDTYISDIWWGRPDIGQSHLAWANYHGILAGEDYHDGARMAAYTVEELLGIDIHDYASINYTGFVDMINYLGGVTVDVAPGFSSRPGGALPTGTQRLDGEQALIFARHRMNPRIPEPGSTSQDGDRIRRNQMLLKSILGQCKELETDDLLDIFDKLEENLTTSMDHWDLMDLANIFYNRDPDEMRTAIVPGEGQMVYEETIDAEIYYFYTNPGEIEILMRELGLKR